MKRFLELGGQTREMEKRLGALIGELGKGAKLPGADANEP
jgi:hypothetical protein